ncbi:MAG: hypothetical protein GY793_12145 [Proteobacteria bacterium]|nr:hypothetical protein [Pseudomonadota bacterium]
MLKFIIKQKGAMFGLDARVALAVMAALALIDFADFIKDINKSKASQYVADLNAVKQAYQAFNQDTQYVLSDFTNPYFYNIKELIELPLDANKPYTKKYKGPYLDLKVGASDNFLVHTTSGKDIAIVSRRFNSWDTAGTSAKCSGSDCFTWTVIYDVEQDIAQRIDKIVDSEETPNAGKLRLEVNGNNYNAHLLIEPE